MPSIALAENAIQRTARKPWDCDCPGNGHQNCTHDDCRQRIAPGDPYIEYVGEVSTYQSGSPYCQPCGEAVWKVDVGGPFDLDSKWCGNSWHNPKLRSTQDKCPSCGQRWTRYRM